MSSGCATPPIQGTPEADTDVMLGDSLEKFFTAVGIANDGIMTLGISWKFEVRNALEDQNER